MKRFSIGFTEEEYSRLESIREWFEEETGVRISRCSIIKRLLFDPSQASALVALAQAQKSFKTSSK